MSDLAKQQFDKWLHEIVAKSTDGQRIQRRDCMTADQECMVFEGWQASRECLVIEMPKPAGLDRMSSEMSIQEIREDNRFNRALELAKKALTAAGVKYK